MERWGKQEHAGSPDAHTGGELRYDGELFLDHLERVAGAVREQGADEVAVQAVWLHAVPASVEDLVLQGVPSQVVQVVKALRSHGWPAPAGVRKRAALVSEALWAGTRTAPPPSETPVVRTMPELLAEYRETRDYRTQWAIRALFGVPDDSDTRALAELVGQWWNSEDDWEAGTAVLVAHRAGSLDREGVLSTVTDGVPAAAETAIGLLSGAGDEREVELLRAALLKPGLPWLGVRVAARVRLTEICGPDAEAVLVDSVIDLADLPWRHDRGWLRRNRAKLVPRLIEALPDPDWWHEAPAALAVLRAVEAVGPLCETVRVAAYPIPQIQALGAIGSPEAAPTLVWLLGHDEPEVRVTALQALSRTGGADLVDVAMKACDDPDVQVRATAARVFARHADGRAVTTLIRLCDTAQAAVAAKALARIGDPRALPTLWALFSSHRDRAVRHAAGRGLVRIEGAQEFCVLSDPRIARAYMWLLGHKPDWHLDRLRTGIKHSDAMVRTRAVEAYGRLRDPAGVEHIRPLVTDSDSRVRAAAHAVIHFLEGLTLTQGQGSRVGAWTTTSSPGPPPASTSPAPPSPSSTTGGSTTSATA